MVELTINALWVKASTLHLAYKLSNVHQQYHLDTTALKEKAKILPILNQCLLNDPNR